MARLIKGIESKLIHGGEPEPRIEGAVTMPIFQSSTFESAGAKSYHDLRYIRLNNTPNHVVLHRKLAALEECRGRAGHGQWNGGDLLDADDRARCRRASVSAKLPVRRHL